MRLILLGFTVQQLWKFLNQVGPALIGLVVALLVLVWLVYRIRTWFGDGEDHTDGDQELLDHLSELHRRGDVSGEEFRSIKGRLTERMDR